MRKSTLIGVSIAVSIAVLTAGVEISAQDKYTVKVPNGLAFSEFRGYEDWSVIAISENGGKIAAIVGNPAMIDAYKEGVPGNFLRFTAYCGGSPIKRLRSFLSSRHHRAGVEVGDRRADALEIGVKNGNAARVGRIQRADDDHRIKQAEEHAKTIILETRLEPVLPNAVLAQDVGVMLQQVHLDRPANLGADIARQKVGKIESARAATAHLPVHRSECRGRSTSIDRRTSVLTLPDRK